MNTKKEIAEAKAKWEAARNAYHYNEAKKADPNYPVNTNLPKTGSVMDHEFNKIQKGN